MGGVFGGIVQQVHHNLLKPRRIRMQPKWFGCQRDCQRVPPLGNQRLRGFHRPFDDAGHGNVLKAKLDLSGGDARDFEQIINQACQLPGLAFNDLAGLALRRVFILLQAQQMNRVGNRRQRVAQFMAEHGQKLVLAPVLVGQCLCQRQLLLLGLFSFGDVGEKYCNFAACGIADAKGVHIEPAVVHVICFVFEPGRNACQRDIAIKFEPILFMIRNQFPHAFACGVDQASLFFKRRVDFNKTVIDWFVGRVKHHFYDAKALIDRAKQGAVPVFRFAQGLRSALGRGDIAGRAKPFDDLACQVQHGDRMRERPSDTAADEPNRMLHLKQAFGANSFMDDCQHAGLIVRADVVLQPVGIAFQRIDDEIAAFKLVHLAPVRTHPEHNIRTRCDQGAKTFFAQAQCAFGLLALGNVKTGGQ